MRGKLIAIILALIIIKVAIGSFISTPLGHSDSLSYMEKATDIFNSFSIDSLTYGKYPPLYPLIIAPALIFQDMNNVYLSILILNAILSSLIIIPLYLLAREFFSKKKSILLATLGAILPPIFSTTFYVYSENLFFLLLAFTIYFLFKTFTENKIQWPILLGLFISLSFLTRTTAIFLFGLVPLITLLHIVKKQSFQPLKQGMVAGTISLLTLIPWILMKGKVYGFTISGILGYTSEVEQVTQGINLYAKVLWTLIYTNYLIIGLGIIFFLLCLQLFIRYRFHNEKTQLLSEITLISTLGLIFIAANNASSYANIFEHRLVGRYVEVFLPFIIILGFVAIKYKTKITNKVLLATTVFLAALLPTTLYYTFFPLNNTTWTHIGVLKYLLITWALPATVILTLLIIIAALAIFFLRKVQFYQLAKLSFIFFLSLSLLNTAIIIYDAQTRWQPLEEVALGQWINDNIESSAHFLLDEDDIPPTDFIQKKGNPKFERDRPITVIGYWIHGDYDIDNVTNKDDYDYVISSKPLPLEVVKTGETLIIYKS